MHPINELRERDGEFFTLFPELLEDENRFYMYFRMSIQCFNDLANIGKKVFNYQLCSPHLPAFGKNGTPIESAFTLAVASLLYVGF